MTRSFTEKPVFLIRSVQYIHSKIDYPIHHVYTDRAFIPAKLSRESTVFTGETDEADTQRNDRLLTKGDTTIHLDTSNSLT